MLKSTVYMTSVIKKFQLSLFINSGPYWIKIETLLPIRATVFVYYI